VLNRSNPNWQDKLLGGTILTGFVVIAVLAALFSLVSWSIERTAGAPKTTVGSSTHAARPVAPTATPSTN
jgi:hypothetical protein